MNEAKDVATLTFFDKFADKGIYTVEVSNVKDVDGNVMEKDTAKFEYVKADVAKVEFAATTIAPEKNVKKLVKVTDKLGRDVTDEVEIEFESSNLKVINEAGTAGKKDVADKKSAIVVAKVKVGDDYVKSAPTTITVKDATAATFAGFYVYPATKTAKTDTDEFAKLKAEEKIDYVYMNGTAMKLGLYYKDQYGEKMSVAKKDDVTITNLTPNVAIVEKDADTATTLSIKAFSAGDAYVKVKNGDVEQTIKIVVREKAKVATMEAEKTDISVGTDDTVKTETIKVEYKDQYGVDIEPEKDTLKATPKDEKVVLATPAADGKTVTITALKEGVTTVELSYKVDADTTLKQTINVTVTKAGTLANYKVDVKDLKLDKANTNNADDKKAPESTEIKVFSTDANGNKIKEVTIDGTDNKLVAVDKDGKEDSSIVNITNNNKVTAVKAGRGYVQVKVGTLTVDTLEFEVVDTKEIAKTAEFDSVAIVLGEIANDAEKPLLKELQDIVKVKNQNGEGLTGFDKAKLGFEYTITNVSGMKFDKTTQDAKLTNLTAPNGSADIVVTKVTYDNGTDNLISSPVVVKLSAKDTTAPKAILGDGSSATTATVSFSEPLYWDNKGTLTKNTDFDMMKLENVPFKVVDKEGKDVADAITKAEYTADTPKIEFIFGNNKITEGCKLIFLGENFDAVGNKLVVGEATFDGSTWTLK